MRGAGARATERPHLSTYHLLDVSLEGRDPDVVAAVLWGHGAVGVEERHDHLIGAFDEAERAVAAEAELGAGPARSVDGATGLDGWREHAAPAIAGPFVVRPPWIDPPSGTEHLVQVVVDPGHAFGSGSHPSTRLALELLADVVGPGSTVLDVGCGSGVLSIAAALVGASATALDTDPAAVDATRRNALTNAVAEQITVVEGDPTATAVGPADLVVVNMTIDLHEQVAAAVRETAEPGTVIVSGVLGHQVPRAIATYHGRELTRRTDGDWVGLVLDL